MLVFVKIFITLTVVLFTIWGLSYSGASRSKRDLLVAAAFISAFSFVISLVSVFLNWLWLL